MDIELYSRRNTVGKPREVWAG